MSANYAGANGIGIIDGSNSVLTFTTTRAIQAGEHVVVLTGNNGGSVATTSITVGALSLALDKMGPNTFSHEELWSGHATALIAAGSTVTVTLPSPVATCIHAICVSFTGIRAQGFLGPTATNSVASANQASGITAATTFRPGVSVAGLRGDSNQAATFTPLFSYVSGGEIHDASANMSMSMTYLLNPPIGVQEEQWTVSLGGFGGDGLIAFYNGDGDVTPPIIGGYGAC